jgi:hypothetical protein
VIHLNDGRNIHLQRAIALYGLPAFIFIIAEFCKSQDVIAREQHYLNWLFSLPSNLRYNFNPIADKPPMTPDTRAKMSSAKSGSNNPNYGQVAYNVVGVSVFTLDGKLVKSFESQQAAANFLGLHQSTVNKAIKRGHTLKSLYKVVASK